MDRRLLAVAAVVGLLALAAGFALAWAGGDDDGPRTITVTGTGKAEVVPDTAEVGLGASATAATAAAARSDADAAARRVIALLRARGVEDADIQTSQVTVSPNYDQRGAAVTGYTATNTVTATLRDLAVVGELVAAAVEAGANLVSGPTLSSSRQEELYNEALADAIPDARAKAEAIAAAGDAELGEIRSLAESGGYAPIAVDAKGLEDAAATPIEPGTLELEAQVTVVFELDD
jgi:uncharacterized protein YggE